MTDTTTKTETAVVKRQAIPVAMGAGGALMPANLQEAIEVARLIASSGMTQKIYENNVGACLVAMQFGAELGLSPMSALQNITVIGGRACLWGDAVLALVVSHPDCIDVVEEFDDTSMTATCTVRRRGRQPVVRTFSQADAKTAGLWAKQGPWQGFPKRMLAMRARGFACRDAMPDVLRGLRVAEEVRDYDVIDGEFESAPQTLTEGTHSFGFNRPKAEPQPEPEKASPPVEQQKPAPRPMTEKEKAWRAKQAKVEPKHDPVTGEVEESTDKPQREPGE